MEQATTDSARVEHPRWCLRDIVCTEDGLHRSRALVANTGDAHDALRVWLEQPWALAEPSAVLEVTSDGETAYSQLPLGQVRVLRHQLGRLLDTAKRPRKEEAPVCRYCGSRDNLIRVTSVFESDYWSCRDGHQPKADR